MFFVCNLLTCPKMLASNSRNNTRRFVSRSRALPGQGSAGANHLKKHKWAVCDDCTECSRIVRRQLEVRFSETVLQHHTVRGLPQLRSRTQERALFGFGFCCLTSSFSAASFAAASCFALASRRRDPRGHSTLMPFGFGFVHFCGRHRLNLLLKLR